MLLTALVCAAAAFTGLAANGFWTDELFTAYFADPDMSSAGEVVTRGAEDVHPPGYYLLVWLAARVTEADFDLVARGVSAALGVLALVVIYVAPGRGVGVTARLVAVAFVATSAIWAGYTHEARSYTLVFVLVGVLAGLALRADERLRAGGTATGALVAVAAVAMLAGLVHYYTVLVSGGVFAMLLLSARSWPARARVVVAGLSVLAVVCAFLAWHLPRIVADVDDTWFSATAGFILQMTRAGVGELVGDRLDRVALGVVLILMLVARMVAQTRWPVDREAALLIGAGVLAPAFGVAVTVLAVPMYSSRMFAVLAPLLWVALAHIVQGIFARLDRSGADARLRAGAPLAMTAALMLSASSVLDRGQNSKEPYRESARAVASRDGCLSATIPVIWWEQPYFSEDDPERFHGFYLPEPNETAWLPLPRDALQQGLESAPMRRLVRDTESGARDCPVLLWEIHASGGLGPRQKVELLERHLQDPDRSVSISEVASSQHAARLYLLE
ncbi:hypothetical protein Salmuc_00403 [Salipiger mucosus DSM 16094]|uniref:Glycosyltransferase RgtA/B/C/D-like domain-containing protein n=1 Tax=Salipiger mucosus DSM 16094 TaxID=1123237 RepID=S9Q5F5_9RHOB|nr:hypothetical protein Salmuc_00403 [Salipiger mucosus DSM 16094]